MGLTGSWEWRGSFTSLVQGLHGLKRVQEGAGRGWPGWKVDITSPIEAVKMQ